MYLLQTLCKVCQETKTYMVAFECFEGRWKFPKAYHLFYDLFYKAAVGDKRWKESLQDNKPFGNPNTEAFALMILKNNYHAWMAQASVEGEFENQYDIEMKERKHRQDDDAYVSSVESTKKCILEELYPMVEYHFATTGGANNGKKDINDHGKDDGGSSSEDEEAVDKDNSRTADEESTQGQDWRVLPYSSWRIVTKDGDPGTYRQAFNFTQGSLELARGKISDDDIEGYKTAVESLQRLDTHVEENSTDFSPTMQRRQDNKAAFLLIEKKVDDEAIKAARRRRGTTPRVKKRRKLLRDLKCFTKNGDVRSAKQRGWTSEGYHYHAALTKQIRQDEEVDRPFVELYRRVTLKIKSKMEEINQPDKKEKFIPEREEVWEL